MTDERPYKAAERGEYVPRACSKCGGTDVRVDWKDVGVPGEDAWLPGLEECKNPQCPSRPQIEDIFS